VAMSLLGGVMVYGRPVLQAFGLWQTVKRFTKPSPNSSAPATSVMDKPHARQILEVNDEASHEEIIAAHKRLIAKNHPDKGGSTYLASQINQAKDVLLKD
ncbi:MAG: DnaJ domain-containing protein, partial [Pseudomonadales bacterium]